MLDRRQLLSDERLADLGGDQPGGSGDLSSTPRANQATLTVQGGARDGMTLLLTVTPFTLGREPSNDVNALDATVSRHHAVIWGSSGRWILRDLASTNGTYVNRRRITGECQLHDGDVVRLARSAAAFQFAEFADT